MSNGVGYTANQYIHLLTLSGYEGEEIDQLATQLAEKDIAVDSEDEKKYGLTMDQFEAVIGEEDQVLLNELVENQTSDEFVSFITPPQPGDSRFPPPTQIPGEIPLDPRLYSADEHLEQQLQLNQLRVNIELVKNIAGVNLEVKTLGFKSAKAFAQGLGQVVV